MKSDQFLVFKGILIILILGTVSLNKGIIFRKFAASVVRKTENCVALIVVSTTFDSLSVADELS